MVTISHITQKLIDDNIILQEAISMGIVNWARLALYLKPDIEKIFGKDVKLTAISRSIERYSEKYKKKQKKFTFNFFQSINLNNDISYIVVHQNAHTLEKIQRLYYDLDFSEGGVFNILQGNHEIAIITKKEYEEVVLDCLGEEEITHVENDHDLISLTYSKDYSLIPGVIYNISRHIAWENINVLNFLHTPTELTLIVHENDSTKCFSILRKMLKEHKGEKDNSIKPAKQVI